MTDFVTSMPNSMVFTVLTGSEKAIKPHSKCVGTGSIPVGGTISTRLPGCVVTDLCQIPEPLPRFKRYRKSSLCLDGL